MSEANSLSEELKQFEATLSGLVPATSGIDRDRLMFRLGQLSAHEAPAATAPISPARGTNGWAWAAVLLGVTTFALGARLAFGPAERIVERMVYVDRGAIRDAKPAALAGAIGNRTTVRNVPSSFAMTGLLAWSDGWDLAPKTLSAGSLLHSLASEYAVASEPIVRQADTVSPTRDGNAMPALRSGDRHGWSELLGEVQNDHAIERQPEAL